MPLLTRSLDDKSRRRIFERLERIGAVAPEKNGIVTEAFEGAVTGLTSVASGVASTLDEVGVSAPYEAVNEWKGMNNQYNPSPDYDTLSLNPADIARTITTGLSQSVATVGAGVATTIATGGNVLAGGAVMFGSTFSQTYGDEVKSFRKSMPEGQAKGLALVSSVGQSLLETILGPEAMINGVAKSFMKNAVKDVAKKVGKKGMVKILKAVAKGSLEEGTEEVLQSLFSNAVAKAGGDPRNMPSVRELMGDFVGGALPGGIMGGGMNAIQNRDQIDGTTEGADSALDSLNNEQVNPSQTLQLPAAPEQKLLGAARENTGNENALPRPITHGGTAEFFDENRGHALPAPQVAGLLEAPVENRGHVLPSADQATGFENNVVIKSDKDVTDQVVSFIQNYMKETKIDDPSDIPDGILNRIDAELIMTLNDPSKAEKVMKKAGKKLFGSPEQVKAARSIKEQITQQPKALPENSSYQEPQQEEITVPQSMGNIIQNLPEGMTAERTKDGWKIKPISSKTADIMNSDTQAGSLALKTGERTAIEQNEPLRITGQAVSGIADNMSATQDGETISVRPTEQSDLSNRMQGGQDLRMAETPSGQEQRENLESHLSSGERIDRVMNRLDQKLSKVSDEFLKSNQAEIQGVIEAMDQNNPGLVIERANILEKKARNSITKANRKTQALPEEDMKLPERSGPIISPQEFIEKNKQPEQVTQVAQETVSDAADVQRIKNDISEGETILNSSDKMSTAKKGTQGNPQYQESITGVPEIKRSAAARIAFLRKALPYAEVTQLNAQVAGVKLPNGQHVTIQLVDNITTKDGGQARGAYYNANKVIQLANIANQGTVDHEVWHMAKAVAGLSEVDQAALDKKFKGDEELEAEGYRMFQESSRAKRGPIAKIFKKIMDTFKKIAHGFGYTHHDVVFEKAATGDLFSEINDVEFDSIPDVAYQQANPFEGDAEAINDVLQEDYKPEVKSHAVLDSEADVIIKKKGAPQLIRDLSDGKLKLDSDLNMRLAKKILDSKDLVNALKANSTVAFDAMRQWIEQGTSAGRLLNARKHNKTGDIADDTQSFIKGLLFAPTEKYKNATPEDKKGLLDSHEKPIMDKTIKAIKSKYDVDVLNISDDQANNAKLMSQVMREIQTNKSAFKDKAFEYWINGLLSRPTTHMTNMLGNGMMAFIDFVPQRLTEASINIFKRDTKSASFSELGTTWGTLMKNFRPAMNKAYTAFDLEMSADDISKLEINHGAAIGGKLGRFIRTPGRFLLAADEFAKAMIIPAEAATFAYRQAITEGAADPKARMSEILADESSDVFDLAHKRALELTFQQEPGAFVKYLSRLREEPGAVGQVMKYTFPFLKTPANIIKTGIRKSPLGSIKLMNDVITGKNHGDKRTKQMAEQVIAWGVVSTLANLIGDDEEITITGSRPRYGTGEYAWKMQNLPPTSIKIGDSWFDYNRVEPLSGSLAMIVDGVNAWKMAGEGAKAELVMKKVMNSALQNIRDKTFLQSVGDIMNAVEDPNSGARFATNFVSSWVPNIWRGSVNSVQDKIGDRRNYEQGWDWLAEQFTTQVGYKAGISIPQPRVDMWGRDVENRNGESTESAALSKLWKVGSSVKMVPANDMDKADQLLMNFNRNNVNEQYWPSLPAYWHRKSGETQYMSGEQYHTYAKKAGRIAKNKIDSMIRSGRLNYRNPNDRDIKRVKKILTEARKRARK